MKKSTKNDMLIGTLHRFLNAIAENPGICINKIYLKNGISMAELIKLKRILLPISFIKSENSTLRETRLKLTDSGHLLNIMIRDILFGEVKP